MTPTSIDFGDVGVGCSVDKAFVITNNGCGTLAGTVSESCDEYSIVQGEGSFALNRGQSHTVAVRFTPTSAGSKYCGVQTGSGSCGEVTCTGTGSYMPAVCSVTPTSIQFGQVAVGSSMETSFTIANVCGGTPLVGTVSESCTDYSLVSGGGGFALDPGQSREVSVRFAPTSTGQKSCAVVIGTALCENVSCTGIGMGEATGGRKRFHSEPEGGLGRTSDRSDSESREYALGTVRPNPFNPTTTISFTLPERARVTLSIYDVEGRLVRTLLDEVVGEGYQERIWNGRDAGGTPVSSGVYFYRLTAGGKTLTKKMVLLK